MPTVKIKEVIWIDGSLLGVFYTPGKCWQFRVISPTGQVFGEERVYYTALAALNAGRICLGLPTVYSPDTDASKADKAGGGLKVHLG